MADVKPPRVRGTEPGPEPDEDRAQLILITGLTLAVILVAVVLLLNTVIYTENLATRGVDAGGAEAVDFRDGAVEDVAAIMEREHRNENASGNVVGSFTATTDVYADTIAGLRARDGMIANVDVSVEEAGYFITQNASVADGRDMTASDGTTTDWTVAGNATHTRNFAVTVTPESLSSTASGAFTVVADGTVANGTGQRWRLSLSNPDAENLTVTVDNGTGEVIERTFESGADGTHTIDVTGGTVNGEPFDALVWADGVQNETEPYHVRYENGDAAEGTYRLVVDERDAGTETTDPAPPRVTEAVYSAEIEVYHRTPELEYSDVVRVAPGERDA